MTTGAPPIMAPWNLALRFGLELAALGGLALGGWNLASGPTRVFTVVAAPVVGAVAWGVFNVRNDPSRSGAAPVEVSGLMRLAVELTVLGAGVAGFAIAGFGGAGAVLATLIIIHYLASHRRLAWLVDR